MQVRAVSILLAIEPTPATLMLAAQHLYQLSKHPENDSLFLDASLLMRTLKSLARACPTPAETPVATASAAVLLTAALKNAANLPEVRTHLATLDSACVFARLLHSATALPPTLSADGEPTGVALAVQALGAMRALAASPEHAADVVAAGAITCLRGVFAAMPNEATVAYAASRQRGRA